MISTADELRDLWASPAVKDMLCKKGVHYEVVPSYPEHTALLNQQLQDDEDIPMPTDDQTDQQPPTEPKKKMKKRKLKARVNEDK